MSLYLLNLVLEIFILVLLIIISVEVLVIVLLFLQPVKVLVKGILGNILNFRTRTNMSAMVWLCNCSIVGKISRYYGVGHESVPCRPCCQTPYFPHPFLEKKNQDGSIFGWLVVRLFVVSMLRFSGSPWPPSPSKERADQTRPDQTRPDQCSANSSLLFANYSQMVCK